MFLPKSKRITAEILQRLQIWQNVRQANSNLETGKHSCLAPRCHAYQRNIYAILAYRFKL